MSVTKEIKRVTTNSLQEMKKRGERIAMLTAYDYSMATIVDEAGMDIILVGDSASNVMAGHETTATALAWTLERIVHTPEVQRALSEHRNIRIVGAVYELATGKVRWLN